MKCRILDYNNSLLSYNLKDDLGIKLDINSSDPIPELEFENIENGMIVKNIPSAVLDFVNLNNTIFTTKLLDDIIKYNKDNKFFEKQKMISALDHPVNKEYPDFKNGEVSHAITNMYYKDINDIRILFSDFIVYNSTEGKNLQAYLKAHANLGISIRGLIYDYSTDNSTGAKIFTSYEILGIDVVTVPSNMTYLNMDPELSKLAKSTFGNMQDTNSVKKSNEKDLLKQKEDLIKEFKKYL